MPVTVDTPPFSSYVQQSIVLNGLDYVLEYKYNSRADRLQLSIYRNGASVLEGLTIVENQMLTHQYLVSDKFSGELVCTRIMGDGSTRATLGTIGIGLPYELQYFTEEELNSG